MSKTNFYRRQMILKEVGEQGQQLLTEAHALIVGAGGLGHPVATYLASSGVGKITIIDDDLIEESNLHRQPIFTPDDIGQPKAEVLSKVISKQNPYIKVDYKVEKALENNIEELYSSATIILDCTDNFATKFLLHDAAFLYNKILVQASIYQFEGQIQAFDYSKNDSGCLRCLWPKTPEADCVGTCATSGVIGAVAGVLGTMQAMHALNLLLGIGESLINKTFTLDLKSFTTAKLKWSKSTDCPLCGSNPSITDIHIKNYHSLSDYEVPTNSNNQICIDIRELDESDLRENIARKPLSLFEDWKMEIDPSKEYLFICQKGIRSKKLVNQLRKLSYINTFSLNGGITNYNG